MDSSEEIINDLYAKAVEENSAIAQESSSYSSELASQAEALKELTGRFKTK